MPNSGAFDGTFDTNIELKKNLMSVDSYHRRHQGLLANFDDRSQPKMETLVLIPQEFALVVTPGVCSRARGPPELTASVWTTAPVPRGALCYPFQGTIRIDKLEVYSYVAEDDVSFLFFVLFFLLRCRMTVKPERLYRAPVFRYVLRVRIHLRLLVNNTCLGE